MNNKDYGINFFQDFPAPFTRKDQMKRALWTFVWRVFISWNPRVLCNGWIRMWYRVFGATISDVSYIHPTARVWAPWNLEMAPYSTIGSDAYISNVAKITLGRNCVISERAYLCTASHNIYSSRHEQINKPIILCDRSWVAADAFVGMGVTIGEGAVVGARSAVFKDVEPWTVVGGNPAKFIKKRIIKNE